METQDLTNPLRSLDEWEDYILKVYPDADVIAAKPAEDYRDYSGADARVREFYRLNHQHQTWDFVEQKHRQFLGFGRAEMTVWEAFDFLNQLVDDSDPDTDLDQFQHLLQTAEAIRKDGHPEWMVVAGLVHDMGKVLCLFGEPQWAVVGDTFPVGCRHSDKIVYPEFFSLNPDSAHPVYSTESGVYDKGCGLRNVRMSWGHDEYMYRIMQPWLPEPALYMLRYHSFYSWHREGDYDYLLDDHDRDMLPWVKLFNPYDLYSKSPEPPDWQSLEGYYKGLVSRWLPEKLRF